MSELFMLLQQALGRVRDHCFCLSCIRPAAWLGPGRERVTEADRLATAHLLLAETAVHRHHIIVWTGKAMKLQGAHLTSYHSPPGGEHTATDCAGHSACAAGGHAPRPPEILLWKGASPQHGSHELCSRNIPDILCTGPQKCGAAGGQAAQPRTMVHTWEMCTSIRSYIRKGLYLMACLMMTKS